MADGLLLGTAEPQPVDAPLRIPDRFLPAFAAGGVLTIWLDGCLALWPARTWASLSGRVLGLPIGAAEGRAFSRLLFSSGVDVDLFAGPLVVPPGHRRAADLVDRVVIVGAGDHAELWSPERWEAVAARHLDDLALPVAV